MLLVSMRPQYVDGVFGETKTVELRRLQPRVQSGEPMLIYAASPTKALIGIARVTRIQVATPESLWRSVRKCAGVSRSQYDEYYEGAKKAVGIWITAAVRFPRSVGMRTLARIWPGFHPPQSFRYISGRQALKLAETDDGIAALVPPDLPKAA